MQKIVFLISPAERFGEGLISSIRSSIPDAEVRLTSDIAEIKQALQGGVLGIVISLALSPKQTGDCLDIIQAQVERMRGHRTSLILMTKGASRDLTAAARELENLILTEVGDTTPKMLRLKAVGCMERMTERNTASSDGNGESSVGPEPAAGSVSAPVYQLPSQKKSRTLLLISDRKEDLDFAAAIAARLNYRVYWSQSVDEEILHFLSKRPEAALLWNMDSSPSRNQSDFEEMLRLIPKDRVFGISETGTAREGFTHFIARKFEEPAIEVYCGVIESVFSQDPFGLEKYVKGRNPRQRIELTRSGHRKAAVAAIQSFLTKNGVLGRVSRHVAEATDEILLNAIFSAPRDRGGKPLRAGMSADEEFDFLPGESVVLETLSNDHYFGVSVRDNFGTLRREVLLPLMNDIPEQEDSSGRGMGLSKVIELGLSILFLVQPGKRTEVILLIPNVGNYRNFKKAFRFVSVWITERGDRSIMPFSLQSRG